MNSKGFRPESTNLEQYVIVAKNYSIFWRVSSSKMSIATIATAIGALLGPISTVVIRVLSEVKGGELVPSKNTDARRVRSCLISEVITGASRFETVIGSV